MSRAAVMAHYDPRGRLAPHVQRQVQALADAVDHLVVVTTAHLDDAARAWLSERARLVERDNTGYDFLSYRVGLEALDVLDGSSAHDEVVVCNDSCIGPLVSYDDVLAEMQRRPDARAAHFWGLTETDRVKHHVQSFFVVFRREVLASTAFRDFWAGVEVLPDRSAVIRRYEVGLSRRLYRAGFTSAAYFTETDADRVVARRRVRWWAVRRTGLPHSRAGAALLRKRSRVPWNTSTALADRALPEHGSRLPFVKVDTLRFDPYGLDAGRLLDLCEAAHPAAFAGVREFLVETAGDYPPRPAETLRPVPVLLRPLRRRVDYGRA